MIVPIHGLKYYNFKTPEINEDILLLQESENLYDDMAIAAYNSENQKIGYVSARSTYNKKVYQKMLGTTTVQGKIWSIGRNQILVEIDFEK